MPRRAELTGVVRPDVDDRGLDEAARKVESRMSKVFDNLPGGKLVSRGLGGVSGLLGGGGGRSQSGRNEVLEVQRAQLEKLDDIHEELQGGGVTAGGRGVANLAGPDGRSGGRSGLAGGLIAALIRTGALSGAASSAAPFAALAGGTALLDVLGRSQVPGGNFTFGEAQGLGATPITAFLGRREGAGGSAGDGRSGGQNLGDLGLNVPEWLKNLTIEQPPWVQNLLEGSIGMRGVRAERTTGRFGFEQVNVTGTNRFSSTVAREKDLLTADNPNVQMGLSEDERRDLRSRGFGPSTSASENKAKQNKQRGGSFGINVDLTPNINIQNLGQDLEQALSQFSDDIEREVVRELERQLGISL